MASRNFGIPQQPIPGRGRGGRGGRGRGGRILNGPPSQMNAYSLMPGSGQARGAGNQSEFTGQHADLQQHQQQDRFDAYAGSNQFVPNSGGFNTEQSSFWYDKGYEQQRPQQRSQQYQQPYEEDSGPNYNKYKAPLPAQVPPPPAINIRQESYASRPTYDTHEDRYRSQGQPINLEMPPEYEDYQRYHNDYRRPRQSGSVAEYDRRFEEPLRLDLNAPIRRDPQEPVSIHRRELDTDYELPPYNRNEEQGADRRRPTRTPYRAERSPPRRRDPPHRRQAASPIKRSMNPNIQTIRKRTRSPRRERDADRRESRRTDLKRRRSNERPNVRPRPDEDNRPERPARPRSVDKQDYKRTRRSSRGQSSSSKEPQPEVVERSPSPALPQPKSAVIKEPSDTEMTRSQSPNADVFLRLGPKLSVSDRLGEKVPSSADEEKPGPSDTKQMKDDDRDDVIEVVEDDAEEEVVVEEEACEQEIKSPAPKPKRKYITLRCPHCPETRLKTFFEFTSHLKRSLHVNAMKKVHKRCMSTMFTMRKLMYREQKKIELSMQNENGEVLDTAGNPRVSSFCKTCKLLYHQDQSLHEESASHHKLLNYMNPKCHYCDMKFTSQMSYQVHLATVQHIQSKEDENSTEKMDEKADDDTDGNVDDNIDNIDIDEFVTLDEVGEDDSEEEQPQPDDPNHKDCQEEVEKNEKKGEATELNKDEENREEEPEEKEAEQAAPDEVEGVVIEEEVVEHLGNEFIKPVTMYYCDLCHKFLPRVQQDKTSEQLVAEHCEGKNHIVLYNSRETKEVKSTVIPDEDDDQLDYEAD